MIESRLLLCIDSLAQTWQERGASPVEAMEEAAENQYAIGKDVGQREQLSECAEELRKMIALLTP